MSTTNLSGPLNITGTTGTPSTGTITASGAISAPSFINTAGGNSDYQRFVPIQNTAFSTGTWTFTRNAAGLYGWVYTPGAATVAIGIDLSQEIRTTAAQGFKLTSFDYICTIGVANATSQTATLNLVNYVNGVAPLVTSAPLTGTLPTVVNAQPYVTNVAVTTPAFNNVADSKYVLEIAAVMASTTTYEFQGVVLHYTKLNP